MTKTELSALQELNMSPEELEQRRLEVEAKLHAEPNGIEPSRQRRIRSDKGIIKGPKLVQEAPAGAINSEQKSRLLLLMALVQQTTTEHMQAQAALDEAARRMTRAASDFTAYLNSLTT